MIVVIVGPTGVGKTKLSVELAKRLDGEIINADSTQVYRDLNIATAKVTEEEKEGIAHHLFDIKDITEDYTVYDYQKDSRSKIDEIVKRGKTPIMVGGTGLYIKASLYDYQFEEESIHNDYSNFSNDELYERVLKIDANTSIHKNNRKRLERFLDYYAEHSEPISDKEKAEKLVYEDVYFIGLTTDRKDLYEILNKRVDKMVDSGLLDEAKRVYDSGIRTKAVLTPIGYKELFPYFDGNITLEEALENIKKRTRNYAKRQYTWFNHQMNVNWFNVDFDNFNNTIDEVCEFLNK